MIVERQTHIHTDRQTDTLVAILGAKVWNGLPSDVTSASPLSVFKNRLKTYLFRCCYETV